MPDTIVEFFDQLARRGHEPLLEKLTGTLRFDIRQDNQVEHWLVTIADGDVRVSREERPTDCVVHVDRAVFERMATGRATAQTIWLRNLIMVDGRLAMLRRFDRVFPGPPGAHDPRDLVAQRGHRG